MVLQLPSRPPVFSPFLLFLFHIRPLFCAFRRWSLPVLGRLPSSHAALRLSPPQPRDGLSIKKSGAACVFCHAQVFVCVCVCVYGYGVFVCEALSSFPRSFAVEGGVLRGRGCLGNDYCHLRECCRACARARVRVSKEKHAVVTLQRLHIALLISTSADRGGYWVTRSVL